MTEPDPRPLAGGLPAIIARYRENREEVDAELDAEADAEHVRRIEDVREQRWRDVCPQRFHGATLEWVEREHGRPVVDVLDRWRNSAPRPNLVLLGPVGTGKTSAALSVCRADWYDRGLSCEFWPIVELLDGLRPDGGTEVADLTDVPRLIIDDLGAEKSTEWTTERLYAVVNRRWLEERPTVVTSNLPATRASAPAEYEGDTLEDVIDSRLFSRLIGDGATVVQLTGRDRRRRAVRPV